MKLKRILSAVLCLGILCSLTVFPAAAAGSTAFSDVTDPAVAEATELLRVLGIVDGTGNSLFRPDLDLSRAAFCKMTVELMGNGDKVAGQLNRTIFKDVPSTHWARGYINVATMVTGEQGTALIRGDAYGNFNPDRPITAAEAITILMRVLGYSDSAVGSGGKWYSGYFSTADAIGLTASLSLLPEQPITRAQAALLFENLIFTIPKDASAPFLSRLGGSMVQDAVILSVDATAEDGTPGSVQTDDKIYRTDRVPFSSDFNGTRADLALDKNGKLLAIRPCEGYTYKRLILSSCNANHIIDLTGVRYDLKSQLTVWKNGQASTFEKVWPALKAGTAVTLCCNAAGNAEYLYISDVSDPEAGSVLVLKGALNGTSNPFAALGAGSASIYKNGAVASVSDLRPYDVGIYNKNTHTVQVSDRRLTGIYESASPNTDAPSSVRIMGYDFSVLPSAISDLQSFKIGDAVTLLLTADDRVAGAVSPSAVTGTAVGIARIGGDTASVSLIGSSVTLTGKHDLSERQAAALDGQLVTVSSFQKGALTLTAAAASVTGSIDLLSNTMGKTPLAPNVRFYDSVKGGAMLAIDREDIALSTIPSSRISYVASDYAGRVAYVVLNDVTGDCYDYGFFVFTREEQEIYFNGEADTYEVRKVALRSASADASETVTAPVTTIASFQNGAVGGLCVVGGKLVGYKTLPELKSLRRSSIDPDTMTLTTSDFRFSIAENVQCYNRTTQEWYAPGVEGLRAAAAFSDNLVIYYDKTPDLGGKVRMVIAQ